MASVVAHETQHSIDFGLTASHSNDLFVYGVAADAIGAIEENPEVQVALLGELCGQHAVFPAQYLEGLHAPGEGLHHKANICRVCHASAAKHVASDPQRSRTSA